LTALQQISVERVGLAGHNLLSCSSWKWRLALGGFLAGESRKLCVGTLVLVETTLVGERGLGIGDGLAPPALVGGEPGVEGRGNLPLCREDH
jgi:hypothetical protein